MGDAQIGILHPGEMGAALGAALRGVGHHVLWAPAGRSSETAARAEHAGLTAVDLDELTRGSQLIVSVCPPHAALEVARSVAGFAGLFLDANAVSPATAREIASVIESGGGRFVDGGIIGPPPREAGTTRLYLAGSSAASVAPLFAGSAVEAPVVSEEVGDASGLKMAYAAWTKGTAALLLAVRALARVEGVEGALLDEWRRSLPHLPERSLGAARSAGKKGWRWVGEMEEIASTFASAGLPRGFHQAAAEVFRRAPRLPEPTDGALDEVLRAIAVPSARAARTGR